MLNYSTNNRTSQLAKITMFALSITGCATSKNSTVPVPPAALPTSSVVQPRELSPSARGFQAQELPDLQFIPTKSSFSDKPMRSYQDDINGLGNRIAHDYSTIRNLFSKATHNRSLAGDANWRDMLIRALTDFREAGKLIANYPIVPIRANEEDKAFRPIADLTSNFAGIIERSVQQNTSEYKRVVNTQVKELAQVIQTAQAGILQIDKGKGVTKVDKRRSIVLRAGKHPDLYLYENESDFDALGEILKGNSSLTDQEAKEIAARQVTVSAGTMARVIRRYPKAIKVYVELTSGPEAGHKGFVPLAWVHDH